MHGVIKFKKMVNKLVEYNSKQWRDADAWLLRFGKGRIVKFRKKVIRAN